MVSETTLHKAMFKSEVLVEALPYIRRFNRKIIVVKYGGSAMDNDKMKKKVIQDVVLLKLVGFKPIIVHGGGNEITKWTNKLNLQTNFVNGLRVTDEETLEMAEMVLSKVNKELVSMISTLGVKPVGISGKDGNLLICDKRLMQGKDIGYVGNIKQVNPKIILDLLEKDFLPVIFPIGIDEKGQGYNINGDDAACAIATAVNAEKLAFLSDIEGIYEDKNDPSTVISEIFVEDAAELLNSGHVAGGMLPKLSNCIDAVEKGVSRVHILDGRIPHSLLLEIFTDKGIGTAILSGREEKFYNEKSKK